MSNNMLFLCVHLSLLFIFYEKIIFILYFKDCIIFSGDRKSSCVTTIMIGRVCV